MSKDIQSKTLSKKTKIFYGIVDLENAVVNAAIQDGIEQLKNGGQPRLNGQTGKEVLQFTLAALQSSETGTEV